MTRFFSLRHQGRNQWDGPDSRFSLEDEERGREGDKDLTPVREDDCLSEGQPLSRLSDGAISRDPRTPLVPRVLVLGRTAVTEVLTRGRYASEVQDRGRAGTWAAPEGPTRVGNAAARPLL